MPQLKNITEAYFESHRKFCEYRDACLDMARSVRANLAKHLDVPLKKVQFISLDKDNPKISSNADGVAKMEDGGFISVGLEFVINEEGVPSFRQVIPIKIRRTGGQFSILLCGPDEELSFTDSSDDLDSFSRTVTELLMQNIEQDFEKFVRGTGKRFLGFHA